MWKHFKAIMCSKGCSETALKPLCARNGCSENISKPLCAQNGCSEATSKPLCTRNGCSEAISNGILCVLALAASKPLRSHVHPKELLQSHFANCLGLMWLLQKLRSRYTLDVASEILNLLQLSCAPLKSFSQNSVHVYARVHTSISIQ